MTTRSKITKESSTKRSVLSPASSVSTSGSRRRHDAGHAFAKRILDFSRRENLFKSGDRILVALSGGADSTALLHFFLSIREKFDVELFAAHVNYRLRAKDSDADEASIRSLCRKHAIRLSVAHPSVHAADEETLRDIRYRFFERVRSKVGADHIAVAHNLDDQAETFLLRLIRGSGSQGLSAMAPRKSRIIRPLLRTPRTDIIRYLDERGIGYRIDRSNDDTRYLRNRIRHRLIPLLELDFQPNIREILARSATLIAAKRGCGTLLPDLTMVAFPVRSFLLLSAPDRDLFLRGCIRSVSGLSRNPSLSTVREVDKVIRSDKPKPRTWSSKRLKLESRGGTVTLIRK